MKNNTHRQRITLTPDSIAQEIPHSLLPVTCGALSAKSYRDNQVRPLVWLLFGGTGVLGKQISRIAVARRDRVFIAALDEADIDCDFPLDEPNTKQQNASNDAEPSKSTSNKNGANNSSQTNVINPEPESSAPEIGYIHIDEKFKHLCYRVKCDVRIRESVDRAVQKCLEVFGRIDVVVNCFGYGVMGACEEQFDTEIRGQFETNLMGLFHTIRGVLPYLTNAARMSANDKVQNEDAKKGIYKDNVNSNAPITSTPGHIISFTSSMGVLGTPGFGPYSATRWAAEGLLESLSFEVEHLGCKVTIIETGYAKSGNEEDDNARVARTTGIHNLKSTPISSHFLLRELGPQYRNTPAEYGIQFVNHLDKILATSTVKVASIIWEIGHCQNPPLRLLMGSAGVLGMKDKLRGMAEEIEDWKFLYDENQ